MIGWKSILPTVLIFTVAVNTPLMQVLAQSLSAENIGRLADKFVVQIDASDGSGGSGFIVRKNGGRYTVLTNHHVVKSSSRYTVTASDGQKYIAQNIKVIGNVDLAEIEFVSDRDYTVASLSANTDYASGSKVYAYGWNTVSKSLTERTSQILEGKIAGSLSKGLEGYTLTMNLNSVPGMSGSPLLNEKGKVIGIYGLTDVQAQGEFKFLTVSLGIPISTYITRRIPNSAINNIATKTQTPANDVISLLFRMSKSRIYIYRGDRIIAEYPVVIGIYGRELPVGEWLIFRKVENPGWTNSRTGKVFQAGHKMNPLGERWIGFWSNGTDDLGFHGTPSPQPVSSPTYQGNLQMSNGDVKELYDFVKVGTVVKVIN